MKSVVGVDQFDKLCLTGYNILEEKEAAPNENTKEKANVMYLLSTLRQNSYFLLKNKQTNRLSLM